MKTRGKARARRRLRGTDSRVLVVMLLMLMAWATVGYQLFRVQVVDAQEHAEKSLAQREREYVLPARRGNIYDRNGRELATTIDGVTVVANPTEIEDIEVSTALISGLLDLEIEDAKERLTRDSQFVYLRRQMEPSEVDDLEELQLPGIYFISEPKRVYPAETLASQVVGFVNVDGEGQEGLEYFYQEQLAGEDGFQRFERDPAGRLIPQGIIEVEPAQPGLDLVTTIDASIQFIAEQACADTIERTAAKACTAVVMDPSNGEVLAMAVLPSYDPGAVADADPDAFHNRAVRYTYEPGSTQKVVTVAAALETAAVDWHTEFDVPYEINVSNWTFSDFGDSRPTMRMSVKDIVTRSSNVGTIMIQQQLGDRAHREYLEKFGFGAPTGIDFSAEAAGLVSVDPSCGSCTASAAIGYSVTATPLQMAAVYATIANDGMWVQPHLVADTVDGDGDERRLVPDTRRVVSVDTARTMRFLLETVVSDGTGRNAAVPGYSVGGKTGTSLIAVDGAYTENHMASFIGMAPISEPRLIVAVVVDSPIHGYTGGLAAAPGFAEIMEKSLHHLGVEPDAED